MSNNVACPISEFKRYLHTYESLSGMNKECLRINAYGFNFNCGALHMTLNTIMFTPGLSIRIRIINRQIVVNYNLYITEK